MPTPKIHKENEYCLHFLTLTVIEWIDIFTKPEYFQILLHSLKYCIEHKGLLLYEYVFMTNHIHLIVQPKEGFNLSEIVRDFKRYTTKELLKQLNNDNRKYILNLINNSFKKNKLNNNQIWQNGNYPELVESENFLQQKIDYIHNNPIMKEYVTKPKDWLYSSAGYRLQGDDSQIALAEY